MNQSDDDEFRKNLRRAAMSFMIQSEVRSMKRSLRAMVPVCFYGMGVGVGQVLGQDRRWPVFAYVATISLLVGMLTYMVERQLKKADELLEEVSE